MLPHALQKLWTNKNFHLALLIWSVFALGYVAHDLSQGGYEAQVNQAYQAGLTTAVRNLMNEAPKCRPIEVFEGEKRVQLIDVTCVKNEEE